MSRTDLFWAAAAAALACVDPFAAEAASLRANGIGSVGAHRASELKDGVLTPDPDLLTVTVAAFANDALSEFVMQSMVDGIAVSQYGSLAGRAHAEAMSQPAGPYLAVGQATLNVGFTDGAEVVSDTLDAGTPVTLTFVMALEALAVHFNDGPNLNPAGTGAAARHQVEIFDLDDLSVPSVRRVLVINSRGTQETYGTFEFATAIGHRLELVADFSVSAGVVVDYNLYGNTQSIADVAAENTAELFYQPLGDVRLVSDSGHDYTVPEPSRGALLVCSATLLLLRHRVTRRRAAI